MVTLKNSPFGPKDLLCALFVMIRETGCPTTESLAHRLGTSPKELSRAIAVLRKQGLLQDDALAFTFVGLASTAALLPSSRIELDKRRLHIAA